MEIKFNVTKEKRKALVAAVSEVVGWESVYQGAPSFAFVVNNYTIDRNGTLIYDERTNTEDVRTLLAGLTERGFTFEGDVDEIAPSDPESDDGSPDTPTYDEPESGEVYPDDAAPEMVSPIEDDGRLVVEVPLEGFTQTAIDNLEKLITGKAALIMKAIGTDALPVEQTETTLRFPWFSLSSESEDADAYTRFVCALCDMAKRQKRVTLKETSVDSEKYAFRCFLLRLGFKGKKYAAARKVLLSNLSGNGSFKSGDHNREGALKDATAANGVEKSANAVNVLGSDPIADSGATGAKQCGDCLACSNSMSEPAENDGDFDRLFCVVKQDYVCEDNSCAKFN